MKSNTDELTSEVHYHVKTILLFISSTEIENDVVLQTDNQNCVCIQHLLINKKLNDLHWLQDWEIKLTTDRFFGPRPNEILVL